MSTRKAVKKNFLADMSVNREGGQNPCSLRKCNFCGGGGKCSEGLSGHVR